MPLSTFVIHTSAEFEAYLKLASFSRSISVIQNHHTWNPDYASFAERPDHIYWLESMRRTHIRDRGWADIGQNITIFPDGKIAICRAIDRMPAGIYGANKGAICIENLGNFDTGKDVMKEEQKKAILLVNALLCYKFSLQPVYEQVVYHHWYDTTGRRFAPSLVNTGVVNSKKLQKTCPGSAFFGGNTITSAENNFYPLVNQLLQGLNQSTTATLSFINKKVNATTLNVRSGHGASFPVVRRLSNNSIVQVFNESNGWSRINLASEEWVSSQFLIPVQ